MSMRGPVGAPGTWANAGTLESSASAATVHDLSARERMGFIFWIPCYATAVRRSLWLRFAGARRV
jgi:hypothetical protein